MIIVYYGGIGFSFKHPQQLDLTKEEILEWELKKLKGWKSANLFIKTEKTSFEQPNGLIVNLKQVINYLKQNRK